MSVPNSDLHGSAPDSCPVALVIIDVINDLEFVGGELLIEHALPMAERIAALKQQARQAGVPVIYANDNFGRWRSDYHALVRHCLRDGVRGQPIVELLRPDEQDYFILKPKHSAFFATTLELLLKHLQVSTLILTGVAGNICILFSASDAYLRDFRLIVPADCIASEVVEENAHALAIMNRFLKAETRLSTTIDFEALIDGQ